MIQVSICPEKCWRCSRSCSIKCRPRLNALYKNKPHQMISVCDGQSWLSSWWGLESPWKQMSAFCEGFSWVGWGRETHLRGSVTLWAGILDGIKPRKALNVCSVYLSVFWLWNRYDQPLLGPAARTSLPPRTAPVNWERKQPPFFKAVFVTDLVQERLVADKVCKVWFVSNNYFKRNFFVK